MNKYILIFLCLPLVSIFCWLFFPASRNNEARSNKASESGSNLQTYTPSEKRVTSSQFHKTRSLEQEAEAREKEAEALSRHATALSRLMTPERRKLILDNVMKSKEAHYASLFEKWHLDKDTSNRVIAQVRRRESLRLELSAQRFQKMASSSSKQIATTAIEELKKTEDARDFDDIELITILGHDRYLELGVADDKIEKGLFNAEALND